MLRSHRGVSPKCATGVYVDPSAQVIGDVEIGRDSSIWMNAIVRGDVFPIRIGERTNVQDGCLLHVTRDRNALAIGDLVTFGHGAIVHGCTIASRVLVGIGAIVLDRAEVGEDTIIGAGALVPEGMVIPPRSLVLGMPAKVRRDLTDEEVQGILRYAGNYVEYKDRYMKEAEAGS